MPNIRSAMVASSLVLGLFAAPSVAASPDPFWWLHPRHFTHHHPRHYRVRPHPTAPDRQSAVGDTAPEDAKELRRIRDNLDDIQEQLSPLGRH